MSQIEPPVQFGDTSNIKILDEIKEQVEEPDFDFPPVSFNVNLVTFLLEVV